jgi:hypothetical protein
MCSSLSQNQTLFTNLASMSTIKGYKPPNKQNLPFMQPLSNILNELNDYRLIQDTLYFGKTNRFRKPVILISLVSNSLNGFEF